MPFVNALRNAAGRTIRDHSALKSLAARADDRVQLWRHSLAERFPAVIRPRTYKLMVAVTASCNARCVGCRYGRDFMPNSQLEWPMVRDLLDDAREAGFYSIRLYGGEPLLHPDLARMVDHSLRIGLHPYVTTNAILLEERIDELFAAGLRDVTVGFYGTGEAYDRYVQRPGRYARVERGLEVVRERYGSKVDMQMNWLLMRPSCSVEALHEAWAVAQRFHMPVRVDLVHYSLPYFQEGPDRELQFRPEDRPEIERVVAELLRLKQREPAMIAHSAEGLRSITDWLLLGPDMKVPCTAYEMIWVGADGTVQMCYVTFQLGNLHERRLRDLLFTPAHCSAAQDAFALRCPNCHCSSNERVMRHSASRRKYAADGQSPPT
jgi:cyclic pyranopterin phosphate synthase